MQLLTISRRADFGYSLRKRFERARARLEVSQSYAGHVTASCNLDKQLLHFHESIYLAGLVSIFEALTTDIGFDYLVRYPGHLTEKKVDLDKISKSGSVGMVVQSLAEQAINGWAYQRFPETVESVIKLFDKSATISIDLLEDLSEIKATRDLFVHNDGKVNQIYLAKTSAKARCTTIGKNIKLGSVYLRSAEQNIATYINELEAIIPSKYFRAGKVSALEEMWNATCLAKHVSFADGWTIGSDDFVRPNDEGLDWGWSHSEKMLLDFFLSIYSNDYPTKTYDLMEAVRRWPASTNEGKVMLSWFDSPFWF